MRLYKGKWDDICNNDKYQLIRDKITNSFKDLVFYEEPHKYFLGDRELECVSNVTHKFQEHFDEDGVAQKTFEKHYNDPSSKYYHMSINEIKKSWKKVSSDACTLGTNRHNFGESCFYFMIGKFDNIVPDFADRLQKDENGEYFFESKFPKEDAVVKFWQDLPKSFVPIAAENKVYTIEDEYAYSGTFDILFYYDPSIDGKTSDMEGLFIFDYKTNVDLYKNFNDKRLLPPFDNWKDMSLSMYKLQLTAYQLCLEKIGLKIKGRRLIWLRPNGEYQKIALEEVVEKFRNALKDLNKKESLAH